MKNHLWVQFSGCACARALAKDTRSTKFGERNLISAKTKIDTSDASPFSLEPSGSRKSKEKKKRKKTFQYAKLPIAIHLWAFPSPSSRHAKENHRNSISIASLSTREVPL